MSIERDIIRAARDVIANTGNHPTRLYLGLAEMKRFKNELPEHCWGDPNDNDWHIGKPFKFKGMTVYEVRQDFHLFVV